MNTHSGTPSLNLLPRNVGVRFKMDRNPPRWASGHNFDQAKHMGWEETTWTRNMWKQCWCWRKKIHLTSWYGASLYDISQLVQDFFDQQWCISYYCYCNQNLSCKNSKSCSTRERIDQNNWNSWWFNQSLPSWIPCWCSSTTMSTTKKHQPWLLHWTKLCKQKHKFA